jgi:hypothetical protein
LEYRCFFIFLIVFLHRIKCLNIIQKRSSCQKLGYYINHLFDNQSEIKYVCTYFLFSFEESQKVTFIFDFFACRHKRMVLLKAKGHDLILQHATFKQIFSTYFQKIVLLTKFKITYFHYKNKHYLCNRHTKNASKSSKIHVRIYFPILNTQFIHDKSDHYFPGQNGIWVKF